MSDDYARKTDEELVKMNGCIAIERLKRKGKSVIHEHQAKIASRVVTELNNPDKLNVLVIGETQSGKTGSMVSVIKQCVEDTDNKISYENTYIITGLSSTEWKEQTTERMPEGIKVFHRSELHKKFANEIKNKTNCLIIMDEVQVAVKKNQTIYKAFETAGLLDMSTLRKNNIKILEYSATPNGTLYDLMNWGDASAKLLADSGVGYIGSYELYKNGRVKLYKELSGYDKKTGEIDAKVDEAIQEIKDDIDKYKHSMYHFIRSRNGKDYDVTSRNFKRILKPDVYNYIDYTRESSIKDINKILEKKPEKHTIIFIKEMLRCSKTLKKEYIGILYERYTKNPDDSTIIQGMLGRGTGYDNNGITIIYTNTESIIKYQQLWVSDFEDKTVKWNSNTTKSKNGILYGTDTFNNPTNYHGFSGGIEDGDELNEPVIQKFKTQQEVKKYYIEKLQPTMEGRGPNHKKPNGEGYYETTIRSVKKIYSCKDIEDDRRQGLTKNNYRLYPCYKNINDKLTLQWWFIHY